MIKNLNGNEIKKGSGSGDSLISRLRMQDADCCLSKNMCSRKPGIEHNQVARLFLSSSSFHPLPRFTEGFSDMLYFTVLH